MPYQPITSNATAVPQQIRTLHRAISEAQSATSGQVNGTLQELKNIINALPIATGGETTTSGWQARGGSAVATLSFDWPPGKTKAVIQAGLTGRYGASSSVPMSDRPGWAFRAIGQVFGGSNSVPQNMDTYMMSGNGGLEVTKGGSSTLAVEVIAVQSGALSPGYAFNVMRLNAIVVFS